MALFRTQDSGDQPVTAIAALKRNQHLQPGITRYGLLLTG